ncbi:MAG: hypothetical protein GX037_05290, partial [Trueperella sp.]|nr:hypothetical protein [Trueperella sp.]
SFSGHDSDYQLPEGVKPAQENEVINGLAQPTTVGPSGGDDDGAQPAGEPAHDGGGTRTD